VGTRVALVEAEATEAGLGAFDNLEPLTSFSLLDGANSLEIDLRSLLPGILVVVEGGGRVVTELSDPSGIR